MRGKQIHKVAALAVLAVVLTAAVFLGLLVYVVRYKIETKDRSDSPDETHTLFLQSVGSPVFLRPFSWASGSEGRRKACLGVSLYSL